jgi:hypothetical protein
MLQRVGSGRAARRGTEENLGVVPNVEELEGVHVDNKLNVLTRELDGWHLRADAVRRGEPAGHTAPTLHHLRFHALHPERRHQRVPLFRWHAHRQHLLPWHAAAPDHAPLRPTRGRRCTAIYHRCFPTASCSLLRIST